MKTIDEYLKEYPDASLLDYKEYKIKSKKEELDRIKEQEENSKKWRNDQINKWFCVRFHDNAFRICQYLGESYETSNQYCIWPAGNNISCDYSTKVIKESMNRTWLEELNPYHIDDESGFYWNIIELSQEEADEIASIFKKYQKELDEYISRIRLKFK